MMELSSSQVHFIRCIKPNEVKKAGCPDENYILTQIRYLGVLQTIFIRKNTFPKRKKYEDFKNKYCIVFKDLYKKNNHKDVVESILLSLKIKKTDYLLGNVRVYMTQQL